MEANGTGQILTDSERWTVNGGTIASRTSTTTRTSTIWKANGGQESERGTGQIAKVQKVKGGQVKSRRFLTFPRRFPNGFAPRSDLMEGWKGGRLRVFRVGSISLDGDPYGASGKNPDYVGPQSARTISARTKRKQLKNSIDDLARANRSLISLR
jgi:hypothetical protein